MNQRKLVALVSFSLFTFIIIHYVYASSNDKETMKTNNQSRVENVIIAPDEELDDLDLDDDETIATDEFDIQEKQKSVHRLVQRAADFCVNNKLATVCHAFTHTKRFIEGELYLFLLDAKGVIHAHGEQENLLWKNLWNYRDSFGALAIQSIIKTAQVGPNWITYEWCGSVKVSFVQKVTIDGKEYILGCGYYPHSKKYAAIGLVKGAVSLFNQTAANARPIEEAFSTMGYPLSERFIYGDLYLYALDFNGVIRAQGEDQELIGINSLNRKDAKGKPINREIIERLKRKKEGEGIWIEYTSKNAVKYTYAEKVKDAQGNYYFIACGYYPEIDRDKTIDLVRRGYQFMKASGTSVAVKEFTDKNINTFRYGDLYLFVYDLKGKCIAHGGNSALIGTNQINAKDQDGVFYIRELIDQAKTANGWVDSKLNNSFQATYVEKIDMGVDSYIIGAGMYPVAKPETMTLLVKSAVGYFQTHSEEESFEKFTQHKGEFIRGDLSIFVLDLEGFCYAWGDDPELIWKNLLNWKDDEGKPFIKLMIEGVKQGAGPFVYTFNKRMRVNYIEQVEKGDKQYLIGSSFYK